MNPAILPSRDRRLWSAAGAIALATHAAVAGLVVALARPHTVVPPEPVMLVELPPMAAPAPRPEAARQPQPQPQPRSPGPIPPVAVPQIHTPLPQTPAILPPPVPEPVHAAPASVAAPAALPQAIAPATGAASDIRVKKAEMDYFALLSAHLNRRKAYPPAAKQARQEGIVTIRFTVDRDGNVASAAIKRSSGFGLLDAATLDLLRRAAPLPKLPPTMPRDSVTVSLPIEYALKTN